MQVSVGIPLQGVFLRRPDDAGRGDVICLQRSVGSATGLSIAEQFDVGHSDRRLQRDDVHDDIAQAIKLHLCGTLIQASLTRDKPMRGIIGATRADIPH